MHTFHISNIYSSNESLETSSALGSELESPARKPGCLSSVSKLRAVDVRRQEDTELLFVFLLVVVFPPVNSKILIVAKLKIIFETYLVMYFTH